MYIPRYSMPLGVVVVVVAIVAVVVVVGKVGMIRSTGVPQGAAFRLPNAVATLLRTQEPYFPSLHRDPSKDRFQLDLLLLPLDREGGGRRIRLAGGLGTAAFQPTTKILGADGSMLWMQAPELVGVDLDSGRRVTEKDIRKANSQLGGFWNTARFDFDGRLVASSPDLARTYAIDGATLQAKEGRAPRRDAASFLSQRLEAFLCAGGVLGPAEWLGVLSTRDLQNSFKPGFSLSRDHPVTLSKENRRLYRVQLEMDGERRRVGTNQAVSELEYAGAAFVREAPQAGPLRLRDPDGFLMTYESGPVLQSRVKVARIDGAGREVWSADTGLGRLEQILPEATVLGLVGTEPAVSNKVSAPYLILINTRTGAILRHLLWQ